MPPPDILEILSSPEVDPGAKVPLRIAHTESSVTMYHSRFDGSSNLPHRRRKMRNKPAIKSVMKTRE
jgi:hypothetical protein